MDRITPIPIEDAKYTCMKCLRSDIPVKVIHIGSIGYGSFFDGIDTEVHLCADCMKKNGNDIWDLNIIQDGSFNEYAHEEEIIAILKDLPLRGQELVFNTYLHDIRGDVKMDRQDWIDYRLGELPHDRCKEYGLISKDEAIAYYERFPTCQYPYESVGPYKYKRCICALHGATGLPGQRCTRTISVECYRCDDYVQRFSPIRSVFSEDADDYELFVKAKTRWDELLKRFS